MPRYTKRKRVSRALASVERATRCNFRKSDYGLTFIIGTIESTSLLRSAHLAFVVPSRRHGAHSRSRRSAARHAASRGDGAGAARSPARRVSRRARSLRVPPRPRGCVSVVARGGVASRPGADRRRPGFARLPWLGRERVWVRGGARFPHDAGARPRLRGGVAHGVRGDVRVPDERQRLRDRRVGFAIARVPARRRRPRRGRHPRQHVRHPRRRGGEGLEPPETAQGAQVDETERGEARGEARGEGGEGRRRPPARGGGGVGGGAS